MTSDEMHAIYERLQTLQSVDIDHALERGKDYLVERLMDCRRRQDECGQLAVRVKRAMFNARVGRRNAKAVAALSKSASDADLHRSAEDLYDEMKALEECVGVCRGSLRAADSDIRLAATLLGIQVVLGQPGTPVASDTAKPVLQTPADAVPGWPVTVREDQSGDDLDATFDTLFGGSSTTEGHTFVTPTANNGTVAPGRPPSATVTVDDAADIDFDELLAFRESDR